MADKRKNSSGRHGSVLMEFVIVAPLYFALLGGLFFVGELMLNRFRLMVGDHVGTWLAGTRLMERDGENDAIGPLLQNYLFRDTLELAGNIVVERDPDRLSYFMALYKGGIKELSVSVPDWVRGMHYMYQCFSGNDNSDLTTKRTYDYLKGEDFRRSFSFHRIAPWAEGYNRAASAAELVGNEILSNVLGDNWILSESELSEGRVSQESETSGQVTRQLSEWSE